MTAGREIPGRLRIAIATLGRFHVLDLARELDALGHDVRFYSYVPKRRAVKFGLPARCHVGLLPFLAPLVALQRWFHGTRVALALDLVIYSAADWLVAWRIQPCDVFIGMSGIYVKAPAAARSRFGAKVIVERGSTHIDTQKMILDHIRQLNAKAATVPAYAVRRERAGYALADRIVIPSLHAEKSFLEQGFAPERLFRNPYGVNLAMFTPDPAVTRDPRLILFVGGWSYQKGVDVLSEAMLSLAADGFRLRHVGGVGDAPLPLAYWFESIGSIDQQELPAHYRQARCLALPSRQEGLSLVQMQALACGCPVIGSTMSGASDLKTMLPVNNMVQVAPVDDPAALTAAIKRRPERISAAAELYTAFREQLTWNAYARRYEVLLLELIARRSKSAANPAPTTATGKHTKSRMGDV